MSLHEEITNKIVKDLENGAVPWEKPWICGFANARNVISQKDYSGINTLLLAMAQNDGSYQSNQWLTFKQASDLGGKVKKGEKASRITFYKPLSVKDKKTDEDKTIPFLRVIPVFNAQQVEGLEKLVEIEVNTKSKLTEVEILADIESVIKKSGAILNHDGGTKAFYSPSQDQLSLPKVEYFKSTFHYYATMLHELTHWTGHESRCDRFQNERTKANYAFEELVAELGASFLCGHFGLTYSSNHTSYIASWIKLLKDDDKAIFKAATLAKQSCDFLLKTEVVND